MERAKDRKHLAAKYVLYSHYFFDEDQDFAAFQAGVEPAHMRGVTHLKAYLGGLTELLNTPGYEGVLVLFYASGFIDFIEGISTDHRDQLLGRQRLDFARAVAEHIYSLLAAAGLADRVRILTSLDLYEVLGSTHAAFAEKFRRFITGAAPKLRYDAPKIVESILRLRLLGTGIPVLRLDQDVIFRVDNHDGSGISDLGLLKSVVCSVRAYQLRLEQASVSNFLFSTSYDSREVRDEPPAGKRFAAWSGAFATRVHPAVLADPEQLVRIQALPADQQTEAWDKYLEAHTEDALVLQFMGLKRGASGLEADGLSGIAMIGAPPLTAVISGALLSLSDGAILDLPPFSNFRHNVMWIDDHLKYSLHRAMNHFASRERLRSDPGLGSARLNKVAVIKDRPRTTDLPDYVFNTYLPTLLWGTIVDAWITADPILKCRRAEISEDKQQRWEDARAAQPAGILPRWLSTSLRRGHLADFDRTKMKDQLRERAIERINEVRESWSTLRSGARHTFASAWALGEVRDNFAQCLTQRGGSFLWEGIAPDYKRTGRVEAHHLTGSMLEKLNELIGDAVKYVDWTLNWPQFVQIVRSAKQGSFVGDLSWSGPAEAGAGHTGNSRSPVAQTQLPL